MAILKKKNWIDCYKAGHQNDSDRKRNMGKPKPRWISQVPNNTKKKD